MLSQSPDIRAGLYIVATPIGTASDISLRALHLIANSNVLVAEDKRNLLKLMKIHDIKLDGRQLLSYHDHNGQDTRPKIMNLLTEQKSVVFVSDAGTPLIADPGYRLVLEAISNEFYVSGAPGASAVLAALIISGLPTDKFFFGGFIPSKTEAINVFFKKYLSIPATLVFFESSTRLSKTLAHLCLICEPGRRIVVCRELTKRFEEVKRGTLKEVAEYFISRGRVKGEIVLLLSPPQPESFSNGYIDKMLIDALDYMSSKDAVNFVARHLNMSRKFVYKRALLIRKAF